MQNSKEAIIVAGPNGAGKTTFITELMSEDTYEYISADRIAESLSPDAPERVRLQAGREFFIQIRNCIKNGTNCTIESTLSGRSFKRIIKNLEDADYQVSIIFVFLDSSELCIRRIEERVRQGGHHIPREDVIRRFLRSKQNFWSDYRLQVNRWYLYYNAGATFQDVAFGERDSYTITNDLLFDLFVSDLEKDKQ